MGRLDNQIMQANVFAVVGVIEKICHCRVTKASFDFVQDVHDKVKTNTPLIPTRLYVRMLQHTNTTSRYITRRPY